MVERFNEGEQGEQHGGGERRLVLDAEEERTLEHPRGDGHQPVIQPPVGTIGGPRPAAGDATDTAHTVPAGGGPASGHDMPAEAGPDGAATATGSPEVSP